MQKAMSWAQINKVKWKSRAGRKLGDSHAPGPLNCSHLCDPSPSLPWRSEPPERPRQLTAAKTNFPRGGGPSKAPALPLIATSILCLPRANPPIVYTPIPHPAESPQSGKVMEWPTSSGLWNFPLRVQASKPREPQRIPAPGKHSGAVGRPGAKAGLEYRECSAPLTSLPAWASRAVWAFFSVVWASPR